jgi:endonuclease YncB( thermonuclease family)
MRQSESDPSNWVMLPGPREVAVGALAPQPARATVSAKAHGRDAAAVSPSGRDAADSEAGRRNGNAATVGAGNVGAPEGAAGARDATAGDVSGRDGATGGRDVPQGEPAAQAVTEPETAARNEGAGEVGGVSKQAKGKPAEEASEHIRRETADDAAVREAARPGTREPAESARLFQGVSVRYDGLLQASGEVIALDGVSIPNRRQLCTTLSGARWACGQRAFMALRSLVEARDIVCKPRSGTSPITARCKTGNTDIGWTMLREGWANVSEDAEDGDLVDAVRTAKQQKLGLWADTIARTRDGYGYH